MKKILAVIVLAGLLAGSADAANVTTISKRDFRGSSKTVEGYMTIGVEAYVTGGFALTEATLGMNVVDNVTFSHVSAPSYFPVYDYTNEKIILYWLEINPYAPAASPATSDYFVVSDDNSAASNGKLLVIGATNGGDAYFGYMDATGVTSAATAFYSLFSAADSVTTIGAVDSTRAAFHELAVLIHADTIFFDDDATLASDALMYSGTGLGSMGDIYVPFGNGNMIKIAKKTNSQITVAAALPLYYDENGGLDDKLLSVTDGNADGTFSVSPTYTALPSYNPNTSEQVTSAATVTVTIYFTAVGR